METEKLPGVVEVTGKHLRTLGFESLTTNGLGAYMRLMI